MLWRAPALRRLGVLGINRRNGDYVMRYNERRYYPFADDKLRTKSVAIAAGIAVPDLYGVIETQRDIRRLPRHRRRPRRFRHQAGVRQRRQRRARAIAPGRDLPAAGRARDRFPTRWGTTRRTS